MRALDEDKQKQIGFLMLGGGAAFLFGGFVAAFGLLFGAGLLTGLGSFLVFAGLSAAVIGFILGFAHTRDAADGPPRPEQEGRILARYAINQLGEMLFDNFDEDAEEARWYVRVQFLSGAREELECARAVFDQCGEGMRGMLTIQGSWLGQFVQLLDTEESRAAYRDL